MSERGSCDVVKVGEGLLKDDVGVVVTGTEALDQYLEHVICMKIAVNMPKK
jgi:hypothetical protein